MSIFILFLYFVSSSAYPLCPYPLPEVIEPCHCYIVENKMELSCNLQSYNYDFTKEVFNRIIEAFDYKNEI